MYAYLDRETAALPAPQALVLAAMRRWVLAAQTGHCACAELGLAFARRGAAVVVEDFCTAMATLSREGLATLRLAPPGAGRIADDEARLLALFDAALAAPTRLDDMVAALVRPAAAERLITAVRSVAAHLASPAASRPGRAGG